VKYLPLIWSGIWRKRGRSILIMLQVLIAFLLFGLLQGMKSGIDQAIAETRADILIVHGRQGMGESLPVAQLTGIRAVPGVKAVYIQNYIMGAYQKSTQLIVADAIDPDPTWAQYPGLAVTKTDLEAMSHKRNGALANVTLARKYSWKVGDLISLKSGLLQRNGSPDWTFEVLGTFAETEHLGLQEAILINNDYLNEARADGKSNSVHHYIVLTDDPKQISAVAQAIDDRFANSVDETRTEPLREYAQSSYQSLGDLNFVVRSVVGAVFFALLFSVAAMMMQSLRERTSELAVLKTLGFSDHKIFWIILLEALILCIVAALLGLACAALIFPLAKRFLGGASMPHAVLAAGIGFAVVLALISAALPAWRGMRLQVADALAGR
jgi:putative ABC transport system permease protein